MVVAAPQEGDGVGQIKKIHSLMVSRGLFPSISCAFKEVTRIIVKLVAFALVKLKATSGDKPQRQLPDWLWLYGLLASRAMAKKKPTERMDNQREEIKVIVSGCCPMSWTFGSTT